MHERSGCVHEQALWPAELNKQTQTNTNEQIKILINTIYKQTEKLNKQTQTDINEQIQTNMNTRLLTNTDVLISKRT